MGMDSRPTDKGLKRTKLKSKQMTDSTTLNDDYLAKIQAMNALVRGWASYYRAVNPSRTFQLLDAYVWLRLRTGLAKKYKISPKQVRQRYMHRQKGPKGGRTEFAAQDAEGNWVWRYRATQTRLTAHHKHRVKRGKRKLEQADNRPEMLEASCWDCQVKEHRAENSYRNKMRAKK